MLNGLVNNSSSTQTQDETLDALLKQCLANLDYKTIKPDQSINLEELIKSCPTQHGKVILKGIQLKLSGNIDE